ncbi:coA-binding protein [Geoanaerobacter pelophilus]|uniref:CoA-binding protein n=1 Tax=Geoanaerobacter pelophilus TaxID=60036 RepID=A0ABQ0MJD6_9BACT|nr:CoA-binding protein [Geoanaerobacter pelophilus]GAW67180.1 coA-binding protein [Geoanaerobacter pelophilus]
MSVPDLKQILTKYRTVAVVGLSPDAGKPSHEVAHYLKKAGYRIIPVNPACQEVLGERCYPTLADIPGEIEIVDVFRRSEFLPEIVEQAIAKGAKVVWMQEGVVNEAAARTAMDAGLEVVMNRCMLKEHVKVVHR